MLKISESEKKKIVYERYEELEELGRAMFKELIDKTDNTAEAILVINSIKRAIEMYILKGNLPCNKKNEERPRVNFGVS